MLAQFQNVKNNYPNRSKFDLSYSKLFTADMGQLLPVMCDEVVPGDRFNIGNECVIRMQPLVAPVMHPIKAYVHYFFVPYRLLWDSWESFITGGKTGTDSPVLPTWEPDPGVDNVVGSLWDMLGFPPLVDPDGAYPLDFPRMAYNEIFNDYYRDENIQTLVDLDNTDILIRNWPKDYFSSALSSPQRGPTASVPLSGLVNASMTNDLTIPLQFDTDGAGTLVPVVGTRAAANSIITLLETVGANGPDGAPRDFSVVLDKDDTSQVVNLASGNVLVSDIQQAWQIQKWMVLNARCGYRYDEFLRGHFGVAPTDDTLDKPEYIGGSVQNLIVSEVLQTSETSAGSPQGNMSGHGISANSSFCGQYFAKEYGLIMGIMSIMPTPMYMNGINRQWLRRSKFDFYFPEFANIQEQAIQKAELWASDTAGDNVETFGYQGRYDEMRYKPNMICGLMRTDFEHYHLARDFGSEPALNESFIQCVPDKRIFAVESEPGFIIHFGNKIEATRPMPFLNQPGQFI